MGWRNQSLPRFLLAVETVPKREVEDATGLVKISDEMCIVSGHKPIERFLPPYIVGKASVVLVLVEIQTKAIAV